MKDMLMQFWRARAPRERAVLGGGAALLVLALGYAYAWLPMQRDRAQLQQALPQLREQARQLQQDALCFHCFRHMRASWKLIAR